MIKAKVKAGSILLGGNIQGSVLSVSDQITNPQVKDERQEINLLVNSKVGYFILHDFVAGLDVNLSHDSRRNKLDAESLPFRRTYLLGGPFVRYYLDNGFFGELTVAAGLDNTYTKNKLNVWETSFGVGYAHFINEKISLEPYISYRYFNESYDGGTRTSMGPMFGFGVQSYILRRKAHVIKIAL
ncbi:autotransporter outer membrane beta-barrel domain-containing protein [Pontibacter sp. SGAir0037]|uniref:autotransporter outer membrane beta-barrel domain-containing protein n=1 Tax=Pontibacter sp. SGAir0037 TaxID=2571030 RepID=UPI0010CD2DBA|nr:autotransporter outer membrane beta-barrel domain-containing protein [Pontibacter sp. SGAir0037]QCR22153.1 hypothetical protein C1N53_07235 [Pontibacter sp. SGAir0037]